MSDDWLKALLLFGFVASIAGADPPSDPVGNFAKAKQIARDEIYPDHPITFYCRCGFTPTGKSGGRIDASDCGFTTPGSAQRGRALEWEHVVPAATIAGHRPCWRDGGRQNCQRSGVDPQARDAFNDLHNLVPSVGTLNRARSNYDFGQVEGEARRWGACDFEVGSSPKRAEPAEALRGNVARIWLYMHETHGARLDDEAAAMLLEWSALDPPGDWERERDRRIEKIQGNRNRFVRPD